MKDIEIFSGKTLSGLFEEIYNATITKRTRIDEIITDLRKLLKDKDAAVLLAPLVVQHLDVLVRNDEHLIKVATIVQRIMSQDKGKSNGIDDLLSDVEKEQLLAIASELEDTKVDLNAPDLPKNVSEFKEC